MNLGDFEWGDVISDADGVVVCEAELDGVRCVVKRFADPAQAREIAHYALLGRLGVPTLEVLGSGPDWIALEDLDESLWRPGTPDDLADEDVARALASWYARLHSAGASADLSGLHRESDVLTADSLTQIGRRWPELASGASWAIGDLPALRAKLDALGDTLIYNDFAWTNLAVHQFGGQALMFDYTLLGRGYAYADLRTVVRSLPPHAAEAFVDAYQHLRPIEASEREIDEVVSHLVTLVMAARFEERPRWSDASCRWLAARG